MRLYLLIIIYCLGMLKGFSQDTLQHSLLWKISGNGLKQPSYLYGTMHALCKKDIKLKPKLINVLNQAYTLVFECNFKEFDPYKTDNTVFIFNVPRDMTEEDYMHNNNSLERILDPEKFNFINKFFKDTLRVGRGLKPFNFFQPLLTLAIVKSSMLDCSTSSYEEVIGHKMADAIYQYKGLETPHEIAAVGHRYKTYEVLANDLFETVKNYKALKVKSRQEYKTIVAQYNAEDINQFKINKESEEDRVFVIERNLKWMRKIEQMIKKHITVIAVGAGHLAGENGLIDLLKARGYEVTAVLD